MTRSLQVWWVYQSSNKQIDVPLDMITPKFLISMLAMLMLSFSQAWASHGDPSMGRVLAGPCESCHGKGGENKNEGIPNLSGQKFNYLVKQLREMRQSARIRAGEEEYSDTGFRALSRARRSNEVMDELVVKMSDHDIADVSAFYADQKCHADFNVLPVAPPKFEVRCRVCHGNLGIANVLNVPNIAGQDVSYLEAQLKSFQAGKVLEGDGQEKRRAAIMEGQVKNLTDDDIKQVSIYYARLPCGY